MALDHERRLRTILSEDGWVTIRASKGACDLVALKPGDVRLIQVKHTLRPYDHFGPQDRQVLKAMADSAGATAWLIWWAPGRNKGWKWIPVSEWPKSK
jgi:Holliday junction resolvase